MGIRGLPIIKINADNMNPRQTINPGNIYDAAIVRNMDLIDVAEKLGWAKAKIIRINDGRLKPLHSDLIKLSKLLDMSYLYWFRYIGGREERGSIIICRNIGSRNYDYIDDL